MYNTNSYLSSPFLIIVNFGSVKTFTGAIDCWTFGDYGTFTNSNQTFSFGRVPDGSMAFKNPPRTARNPP